MFDSVFFIFLCIFTIVCLTYILRKNSGQDIRIVWYLSSLTTMITISVTQVAIGAGAIHEGQFVGEYGDLLSRFLRFMLDLEKDILLVTLIAGLILAPQFVCYVFSGISGNAKSPILMGASISFFAWGIIKSFIVCASILTSLGMLYLFGYLPKSDLAISFIGSGMYLFLLAFCMITIYREGEQFARQAGARVPFLMTVHRYFTRNETASNLEEPVDVENLLKLIHSLWNLASDIQQILRQYEAQHPSFTEASAQVANSGKTQTNDHA